MMTLEEMAAIVAKTVALKRKGERFVGLCPFHDECTPSFQVWYSKETRKPRYYCHGCGAKGDAFDWMRLFGGKRERFVPEPGLVLERKREKQRRRLVRSFFNVYPDASPEWEWIIQFLPDKEGRSPVAALAKNITIA